MRRFDRLTEQLQLTLVISRAEARPRTIMALAEEVFAGGVTAIQLREKDLPDSEFYKEAKELREFCFHHRKVLIINDRIDIALAVNADGVHLGQSDLPAEAAAKILPKDKILGVSANTLEAARLAIRFGADYLGVGAIFPTGSKDDASVISDQEARNIINLGLPAIAIGGIKAENAGAVWGMGFGGLAVISALSAASDPKSIASKIIAAQ